jgi:DNA topoisomerase-3
MAVSSFDLVSDLVYKFKNIYPDHFQKFQVGKVSIKNKIVFDDSRLTDHHGLIPLKDFSGDVNSPEGKIFNLVLKRFISNFLENHIYLETDVEIECAHNRFKAKGKKIIEMGFIALDGGDREVFLPNISINEKGIFKNGEVEAKKTKPPFDYTEASLLYDMTNPARLVTETDLKKIFRTEIGLGTQATRAQIIETLLKRSYVERSGKNIKSTSKGMLLVDRLNDMPKTRELTSVSQTAKLEQSLHSMAEGETDDLDFLVKISEFINEATNEWKAISNAENDLSRPKSYGGKTYEQRDPANISFLGPCPVCSAEIRDFPKSFSCSRWKEGCTFTIWKVVANKKLSESQVKKLMNEKKTELIKGFKSKAGKPFEAYLIMSKEGKVEFEFLPR